jgi:hypothetical protein
MEQEAGYEKKEGGNKLDNDNSKQTILSFENIELLVLAFF